MSMERITKEELLAKLGGKALTDDELEQVTGGKTMQQDGQQKLSSEEIENGCFENNPFIEG